MIDICLSKKKTCPKQKWVKGLVKAATNPLQSSSPFHNKHDGEGDASTPVLSGILTY